MEDYLVAFSEVCIKWQYAVGEKLQHSCSNHKRHCRQHHQLPMLMLPVIDNNNIDDRYKGRFGLYDVTKRTWFRPVEPWPTEWRCEGCSHGWLILRHYKDSRKVILREPFSGREIRLPPIRRLAALSVLGSNRTPTRYVLSIDPDLSSKDNAFVLMISWSDSLNVAFFKSGNKQWVYIEGLNDVKDIVYVNGFFYVINGWGMLYAIILCGRTVRKSVDVYKVTSITSRDEEYAGLSYLVESPEGDLLRVNVRYKSGPQFMVHKLVWFSKNSVWEQVMSLGDVALFLGNSPSISVTASDFPGSQTADGVEVGGCCSNSIYFSRHECRHAYIFNLNDRTVTASYNWNTPQTLVWVSPKFV